MTRLTDEEIKKVISEDSIIEQILGRKNTPRKKYDALLSAQIAKLQQYYKDMTAEELREKLAQYLYENSYEQGHGTGYLYDMADYIIVRFHERADRILSIVFGYLLEKVKDNRLVYDKVMEAIGGEE